MELTTLWLDIGVDDLVDSRQILLGCSLDSWILSRRKFDEMKAKTDYFYFRRLIYKTSNVKFQFSSQIAVYWRSWVSISKMSVWKQRLAMLFYILCPAWSIFTPVDILTIFSYFCRSVAIDVVQSLWSSSLECSGMLVVKAFPGRCCGVAAVSKRLLKHQKLSSF